MRWRTGVACVGAATLTTVAGWTLPPAWGARSGANGTWRGRMVIPQEVGNIPSAAYPTVKLAVTSRAIVAEFHGRTQAAHDPESAVSTCRIRYRRSAVAAGWQVYVQVGKAVIVGSSSGGPPDLSPCFAVRGGAMRVRPAGARLLAEATNMYGAGGGFDPGGYRGFLRR